MLIAKDASWRDRPGYAGAGDRRLDPWGARVAMRIARLARIEGRVQGVFFRDWTVAAARRLGVIGSFETAATAAWKPCR